MTTQDIAMEPWLFTDYYFKSSVSQDLMTLTEDAMTAAIKDAKLKAKLYVHPDMVDQFLALLAKSYNEEFEEAYVVSETMGLSKRHMDAIRDDYKSVNKEIEDDFYERTMNIRCMDKEIL